LYGIPVGHPPGHYRRRGRMQNTGSKAHMEQVTWYVLASHICPSVNRVGQERCHQSWTFSWHFHYVCGKGKSFAL